MSIPLATSGNVVSSKQFWNGILVNYNRPHLANKKIIGTKQCYLYQLDYDSNLIQNITELFSYPSILYEARRIEEYNEQTLYLLVESLIKPYDKKVSLVLCDREFKCTMGVYVSVRVLLGKKNKSCLEVVFIDMDTNRVSFTASCENQKEQIIAPPFQYIFLLNETAHVQLTIRNFDDADTPSAEWLSETLFSKIMKWMEIEISDKPSILPKESLSLLNVEDYIELYENLKIKYGNKLINIWCERTDPLKYVYEDIAIASYLICFWKRYSLQKNISFVDLGCGNGLLVYLLNQEGFSGIGVDVRKRKIWDLYEPKVDLQVRTITPSAENLFPEAQWIIGNHSDELTPWIPIISARSAYETNFFLLPCCSYELNGSKFQRRNTSRSAYSDYLDYIANLCEKIGFSVKLDKLRIPSTKRICIASFGREYTADKFETYNKKIVEILDQQNSGSSPSTSQKHDNVLWISDFQARSDKEEIRNCTKLNRNFIHNIIDAMVRKLLSKENKIKKSDGTMWNCGSKWHLSDLVACLSNSDLKGLKDQNGGLQTLLKNHRYIFDVSTGYVQLRLPPQNTVENEKYCEKPCWFHRNHPNGCLYSSEDCACVHEGSCNKQC